MQDATAALKGMLGIAASDPGADQTPEKPRSKNNKNKKKSQEKKKAPQPASTASSHSQPEEPPENQPTSSDKKKKKRKKKNNKKEPPQPPQDANYAWSAFQSSPDASKLPIPAFSSPTADKKATVQLPPPDAPVPDTPELLGQIVSPKEKSNSNLSKNDAGVLKETQEDTKKENGSNSNGKGGVNLAAALANLSVHSSPDPPTTNQPSPARRTHPYPYNHPPQPHFSPQSTTIGAYPMYNNNHAQPQTQLPPPGHITVTVVVPPILPPNRMMVVPSPAGYPVQIYVPPTIPPHSTIPVHVPIQPMHMMPPPQQQQQHRF